MLINIAELARQLLTPRPPGSCVICGRDTRHTSAGLHVCHYDQEGSLGCAMVLADRRMRERLPLEEDVEGDRHYDGEVQDSRDTYHDYRSYIASRDWEGKANVAKRRAGWRCQRCKVKGNATTLHAHHKTYERLYREHAADIEVLCQDCHRKEHGR